MTDITLDDILDTIEPIQPANHKQYTLGKSPTICPYCASGYVLSDKDRLWYCASCGAHEIRQGETKVEFTKEMMQPEAIPIMIDFICEKCGAHDKKGPRAKRVLCIKCETSRINGNRKKGVILVNALKTYVCAKCKRTIHIGTRHYTDTKKHVSRRWHEQCHQREKERPQLGA